MSGLSAPRALYNIHTVTPYLYTDGSYLGTLRVLQGSSFKLSGALTELRGGSNRYAWDVEDGDINAELDLSASEYPNFVFQIFLGKAPTAVTAEASGNASAIANRKGTSMVAATGLLSSLTVSTAADLKFGKYIIIATGAAAIKVYAATNIDANRGTSADFTDDTCLIFTQTGMTTGSTYVITGFGLTLTCGGSATAFTTGDSATFEIRPISTGTNGMTVKVGGLNDTFAEVGYICYAQKRANNEMCELEVYRTKCVGLPIEFKYRAFSAWQVVAKASYDTLNSAVFAVRMVQP